MKAKSNFHPNSGEAVDTDNHWQARTIYSRNKAPTQRLILLYVQGQTDWMATTWSTVFYIAAIEALAFPDLSDLSFPTNSVLDEHCQSPRCGRCPLHSTITLQALQLTSRSAEPDEVPDPTSGERKQIVCVPLPGLRLLTNSFQEASCWGPANSLPGVSGSLSPFYIQAYILTFSSTSPLSTVTVSKSDSKAFCFASALTNSVHSTRLFSTSTSQRKSELKTPLNQLIRR